RVQQLVTAGVSPAAGDVPGSTAIQELLIQEATARQRLSDIGSNLGSENPQLAPARAALAAVQSALSKQMRDAVATTQAAARAAEQLELDLRKRLDDLQKTVIREKTNQVRLEDLQAKAQGIRQHLTTLTQNYDQALADRNLQVVAGSLVIPAEAVAI